MTQHMANLGVKNLKSHIYYSPLSTGFDGVRKIGSPYRISKEALVARAKKRPTTTVS